MRDRQIAGPRRDNHDAANRLFRRASGKPKGAGDAVLLGCGELGGEVIGLLRADAGSQAMLLGGDQLANHPFNPFACFALAKDDFRKAAPLSAVQIDVGEAEIGDGRLVQSLQRLLDAKIALLHLFQQFTQIDGFQRRLLRNLL